MGNSCNVKLIFEGEGGNWLSKPGAVCKGNIRNCWNVTAMSGRAAKKRKAGHARSQWALRACCMSI